MKDTLPIQNLDQRDEANPRAERRGSEFPQVGHQYQSSQLTGGCGTPARFQHPAFSEISQEYFADEAARGFLVDSGIFGALLLAAALPILNGVEAVATLIHTVGVL